MDGRQVGEQRKQILIRLVRALVMTTVFASVCLVAPGRAEAAQQLVARQCNLGPRGDACAYLIHDPSVGRFWAKGAVTPEAGHVWIIAQVQILRCYNGCTFVASVPDGRESTKPMSRTTHAVAGSPCYTWYARMNYFVDSTPTEFRVEAGPYGGVC